MTVRCKSSVSITLNKKCLYISDYNLLCKHFVWTSRQMDHCIENDSLSQFCNVCVRVPKM